MLTYFANLHKNNSFAIIDLEREERQEKEGANKRASRMNGEWREKNQRWTANSQLSTEERTQLVVTHSWVTWLVNSVAQADTFSPLLSILFLKGLTASSLYSACEWGGLMKGFLSLARNTEYFETEHERFLNWSPIYMWNWPMHWRTVIIPRSQITITSFSKYDSIKCPLPTFPKALELKILIPYFFFFIRCNLH